MLAAITFHEASHAFVAFRLGDPSAKGAGRLSLNPLRHIDPFGTLLLPLLLVVARLPPFGYAKPVPINPRYFKDHRVGMMISALAGPSSNLILAAILGLIWQVAALSTPGAQIGAAFEVALNALYGVAPTELTLVTALGMVLGLGVFINLFLAMFNLIPIPPLDGSRVVPVIAPRLAGTWDQLERSGLLIFFLIILVLPRLAPQLNLLSLIFDRVVAPVAGFLLGWVGVLLGVS